MAVDLNVQKSNNRGGYLVFEGNDGQKLKINKEDLQWQSAGGHEHHYLPDFSDETETYVALKCALPNCIHGVLRQKIGKDFISWLDEHRAKL